MTISSMFDLVSFHACHPLRTRDDYDVALNVNLWC